LNSPWLQTAPLPAPKLVLSRVEVIEVHDAVEVRIAVARVAEEDRVPSIMLKIVCTLVRAEASVCSRRRVVGHRARDARRVPRAVVVRLGDLGLDVVERTGDPAVA
jgi:hypothetical protein